MRIGNYNIKYITQKLIPSKRIFENRFLGKVFFEKYEPHKTLIGLSSLSAGGSWVTLGSVVSTSSLTFSAGSNRTIIGNSNVSAGGYDIGGNNSLIFVVSKKPNFIRKLIVEFVFGWKWVEKDKV